MGDDGSKTACGTAPETQEHQGAPEEGTESRGLVNTNALCAAAVRAEEFERDAAVLPSPEDVREVVGNGMVLRLLRTRAVVAPCFRRNRWEGRSCGNTSQRLSKRPGLSSPSMG